MTLVAAILLVLPYLAAWSFATRWLGEWRLGLAAAALAWCTWSVLAAELLSIGEVFTQGPLIAVWGLPALASLPILWRARHTPSLDFWRTAATLERAAIVVIGTCVLVTAFVAVWAAPNNWDSMTYHLTRVEVWRELGAVRHFATHIEPQLYQPPGAELLLAQSYILSGGSDALTALVQWAAYLECIVVGSLAASAMGAPRRTQLGAALLVATIPLAMLEASSTQNDLVLAAALLLASTFALVAWRDARPVRLLLLASVALGLAALTKGTGLMFGLPVGVLIAGVAVRRVGIVRSIPLALAGLALLAAPNAGQWARNHDTYGALVASDHAGLDNPYRVQDPDLKSLTSNVVRNATNHMDLPSSAANERLERWTISGLDAIGIDANDPKTTFLQQPFRIGPFGPHEDHAGSLLLLVLGLWAVVSTIVARDRRQLAWLGVIAAQLLLFCWFITWQNWHVRMHLPLTVALAVLVAVRLGARSNGRALVIACVIASALAPLYLFGNVTRPLVGDQSILTHSRTSTRFKPRPPLEASYHDVIERAITSTKAGDTVGLITGIDDWQYPIYTALRDRDRSVRQVFVSGPSQLHATSDVPDVVICISCQAWHDAELSKRGHSAELIDDGADEDAAAVVIWTR